MLSNVLFAGSNSRAYPPIYRTNNNNTRNAIIYTGDELELDHPKYSKVDNQNKLNLFA